MVATASDEVVAPPPIGESVSYLITFENVKLNANFCFPHLFGFIMRKLKWSGS